MRQVFRIAAALCWLPVLATAQEKKGDGFVYEDPHQCKITFPQEPRAKDVSRPAPHLHSKVQIELKVTKVVVDGQTYRLGFTLHPDAPPQNRQKDQEYFDDFLFGYTGGVSGGKLETDKKVEVGSPKLEVGSPKLQARDFVVKKDTGVIKGRLIMRNKLLILIDVGAPTAKFDEKKADAFIESFEFYLPQAKPKK